MQRPTSLSPSPPPPTPHRRSRSPSQSISPTRARSYMSHRSSHASRSPSRTPSQSRSPSRSRPRSRRSSSRPASSSQHSRSPSRHIPSQQERDHNRGKLIKDSAGLLLGIGVAAIVAHKFWPKGMLYGGKEDWETKVEKTAEKVKDKILGDDGDGRQRRNSRRDRPRSGDRGGYYEERLAVRGQAPLMRSRSAREGDRGRSLDARRRVYQEVDTRWERAPRYQQREWTRERREPSYASERQYHQRVGGDGQYLARDDHVVVVERDVPRHGGRGYR